MTSDEVQRLYNAEPLKELPNDCVIININQNYVRGSAENAIYLATKEIWRIKNPKNLKYVLSEYRGLIVEVFQVDRWYEKVRGYNLGTKKHGQSYVGFGFEGQVAPEEIRNKFINKSMAHAKKRGIANAVRLNL